MKSTDLIKQLLSTGLRPAHQRIVAFQSYCADQCLKDKEAILASVNNIHDLSFETFEDTLLYVLCYKLIRMYPNDHYIPEHYIHILKCCNPNWSLINIVQNRMREIEEEILKGRSIQEMNIKVIISENPHCHHSSNLSMIKEDDTLVFKFSSHLSPDERESEEAFHYYVDLSNYVYHLYLENIEALIKRRYASNTR